MPFEKTEKKESKFRKCIKCGRTTTLFICECGNYILKQKVVKKETKK